MFLLERHISSSYIVAHNSVLIVLFYLINQIRCRARVTLTCLNFLVSLIENEMSVYPRVANVDKTVATYKVNE